MKKKIFHLFFKIFFFDIAGAPIYNTFVQFFVFTQAGKEFEYEKNRIF